MSSPSLISSLDRVAQHAYLRSRGQAYLDKAYIQLVTGETSTTTTTTNGRKRNRRGSTSNDDAAGGVAEDRARESRSSSSSSEESSDTHLPHIDSKYRIHLVAARPEPAVLVIGEPPSDIYLPSTTSSLRLRSAQDRKHVVSALEERAAEEGKDNKEIQPLFWDTEKLPAHQVKMLAEYAWNRQLMQPALFDVEEAASSPDKSGGGTGTKRQRMASEKAQAAMQLKIQEAELDAEIELMRRSFCDKNRAIALKNRAAAGMW